MAQPGRDRQDGEWIKDEEVKAIKESKIGELAASFDIVLGKTAEDPAPGKVQAGVAKPAGMRGPGGPGGPGGPPRRPRSE